MQRIWKALMDEPLIPFAFIGGALFVVYGFLQPDETVPTIEVKSGTIKALESMQQDLLGRPLTDQEQQGIIDGFIEDEILMREAFRMELEQKDSRVRQRLLNVMRSTLDQPVPPPTRAELQAYFQENKSQFETSEEIDFDHVFFSFGSDSEPDDPGTFLASLRDGLDHSELGDYSFFGNRLRKMSQNRLRLMMGASFAQQAFALPLDEWRGPIESPQGIHFVRITAKIEQAPPTFEQMEEFLSQDWVLKKRRKIQTDKIAELGKKYKIIFSEEQ